MACGENPKRVYGGRNSSPQTRMGNVAGYRRAWIAATEYRDSIKRWKDSGSDPAKQPDRNLQLETLAGVLNGEILVHNHCYRADEMAVMIDLAKEFGYKIASLSPRGRSLQGRVTSWSRTASAPACGPTGGASSSKRSTASARTSRSWTRRRAARSSTPTIANGIQRLNQEAAKAMRAGREAGFTIGPADAGQMAVDQSREGARDRQDDRFTRSRAREPMWSSGRRIHSASTAAPSRSSSTARSSTTGTIRRSSRSVILLPGTVQAGEVR